MTTTQNTALTLSVDNFEREVLQSEQPVIVDFWADWCPPCKAIGSVIEEIATEFRGIASVGKVDVDENKSLAERYAISSIPTVLLFNKGEVVERFLGIQPKERYEAVLTAALGGDGATL